MEKNNNELGSAPIGPLLFKLAVPTVVAQLINMLYNVVDRIYLGHIPGEGSLALTGVGVCLPIILVVSAFAALVASGGAPKASIAMGRGDNDEAERILGSCFSFLIIISIMLSLVLIIFNRPMLLTFGASENTIDYASSYMTIYACGTIFVQMTLGMNAFITAQGKTTTSMLTVVIGAVMNIILDPIFIFVFGMGVKGAALATIMSQCVSSVWCIVFITGKKSLLRLKVKNMKIVPALLLPCLALGISTFIMQSTESVISVCFNSSLLKYGGDIAVGAMTICTSVIQMVMLPLQGISQGAQPISSYSYGAGNKERVKKCYKYLLISSFTFSTIAWALILLFPQVFAKIFTPDPELVEYASKALRVYLGAIFVFGIQISCQMTFISIGNALSSVIVAVVRKFVLLIPLIYIVPHFFKDNTMGVFAAEPIADFIAVICTVTIFYFQFRASLSKLDEGEKIEV
ncbi:MAG: MATE family efflux transporter [Spirochaetales bacterium]|nr:MATE family efflux transporter [Spirochaetales bacterium]